MVDIDGGGRPEFVTKNDPFNYMISDGGIDAISPIQILRFANGRLVDVTAEYPLLIEADANFWLAAITGQGLPIAPEYLELMNANLDDWDEQSLCGVESILFSTYMSDMILLDRTTEACDAIEAYYEQAEEPVCSNVVARYAAGGDFCAEFTATVEEWAQLSRINP